jgi:hypothetical protein
MTGGEEQRPRAHSGVETRDFLERALIANSDWTRYADPKAIAVLVLLGLGVKDLVDNTGRILEPHEPATNACGLIDVSGHSCSGLIATSSGVGAAVVAGLVVFLVSKALFPRLRMRGLLPGDEAKGPIRSSLFFGEVAKYNSQDTYRAKVRTQSPHELLDDLAGQVYEISTIARDKHLATQRAYVAVIAFLVLWALSRVSLATI